MNADQAHTEDPEAGSSKFRDLYLISGLFLATLLVLFAYDLRARPALHPDLERYIHIASSFRAGDLEGAVNYHYPPFFPLLIAGADLITGNMKSAAKLASILCTALLLFPVYFLSRSVFGRGPAVFAAGFLCFRFISELAVCKAEQPAMLFIYLAILLGLHALRGRKLYLFLMTGLAFGAGFMTKPEAWAYFLAFLSILVGASMASGLKARRASHGPEDPEHQGRRLRRGAVVSGLVLALGYFLVTGPYLLSYYRDTGMFSFNPKARTLFAIHNFLYRDHGLYQIQFDESGYFTQAQRIYMEGDKKPPDVPLADLLWEHRREYAGIYFSRFWFSAKESIAGYYLKRIAPWVWPALVLIGLWPSPERERRRYEYYLHAFALVPMLTVPLFSRHFPRFYFMMVPWFMMVMGRGADRIMEYAAARLGDAGRKARPVAAAAVFFALASLAIIEIASARPDQDYWDQVEYRRKVAEVLKSALPEGCRYLAENENPSIWRIAGFQPQRQELIPSLSLEGVIALARDRGCKFIVFHKSRFFDRYQSLLPLLDRRFSHPELKPVFRGEGPGLNTYVIYEIKTVECGP
jgi:4-amino-4-deoxy-L-arabinose transferase-like glycosyltransferase